MFRLKKDVTIQHLLTMSAGFEWNESDYYSDNAVNDVFGMISSNNYIDYVLTKPITAAPGSRVYYSSGESMLLSGVVQAANGTSMYNYAHEHLLQPIGINSNFQWETDNAGNTVGGWGINTTLRNYARFGFLYLNKGNWDGQQIISEQWIDDSWDPEVSGIGNYGYQWWIAKGSASFKDDNLPEDTYLGVGIYLQYLIIIPSEKLVIVRTGRDVPSETPDWSTGEFISMVVNAKTGH